MARMPDLDRLKSQLLTSGLQQKDFPLYQVIDQLIQAVRQVIDTTDTALGTGTGGSGTSFNQTFATVEGEKPSLPNSRQLVAGTGIQFNDTFNNLVISGSAIPGSDGSEGDEGMMGPPGVQGPQGAIGPTGPSGSGSGSSMPYYFGGNEDDHPELPALFTLMNGNSIPEEAIIDGTLLARVDDNEVITGQWTFSGAATFFISTAPTIYYQDSDGAANEKWWRWSSNAAALSLDTLSDDLLTTNSALAFVRSGTPVVSTIMYTNNVFRTTWNSTGTFTHYYGLALPGRSAVALTADQTAWNPSGLGTVFQIQTTPNAAWIIRGITAQADGYVVSIVNVSAFTMTINHEDAAASAANRILMPSGVSVSINQYNSFIFIYDTSITRWRLLARTF